MPSDQIPVVIDLLTIMSYNQLVDEKQLSNQIITQNHCDINILDVSHVTVVTNIQPRSTTFNWQQTLVGKLQFWLDSIA